MARAAISIPRNSARLVHYDAACREIEFCRTQDEAKGIRDRAEAIRIYARQLKNKRLEIDAAEIRIRAERRWAELHEPLKARGAAAGGQKTGPRGHFIRPRDDSPTLAEMGISKEVSARAHKIADLPTEIYKEKLAAWREVVEQENERVTTNLLKIGDEAQKHVRGTFGTSENDWYTPKEYVERARKVMGGIDLDPATTEFGQATVCADEFFTPIENGLEREWRGRVWLNPPYSQPDVSLFVSKLLAEYQAGRVGACVGN